MHFTLEVNLNFAMNALFFSDDYIESRMNIPPSVKVIYI